MCPAVRCNAELGDFALMPLFSSSEPSSATPWPCGGPETDASTDILGVDLGKDHAAVAGPRQMQAHAQFWGPLERVPSKEGDVRGSNRETSDRSGMHFIYDRFRPWIADSFGGKARMGWRPEIALMRGAQARA